MPAHKLDNPIWHSLSETHNEFAIEYPGAKFYHPDYCPFGGFANSDALEKALDAYSALAGNFYILGDKPRFSSKLKLTKELASYQMLLEKPLDIELNEPITELVTAQQRADLLALVTAVQPGYFRPKTPELGSYYGIYNEGKLIAAAGERIKMTGYTEVSAVVTHPDYTRKGYAQQLIARTCHKITSENKLAYLHVANFNTAAIKLYEKLGFRTRREISFWNLTKADTN